MDQEENTPKIRLTEIFNKHDSEMDLLSFVFFIHKLISLTDNLCECVDLEGDLCKFCHFLAKPNKRLTTVSASCFNDVISRVLFNTVKHMIDEDTKREKESESINDKNEDVLIA